MEGNSQQEGQNIAPVSDAPQQASSKQLSIGIKIVAILIAVLLFAGGISAFVIFGGNNNQESDRENNGDSNAPKALGQNTIVYGYWQDNYSYINSFDLSTNTNTVLATLPTNVKHIKVLSPTKIMYINNTDERDFGDSLVVRTLSDQKDSVILKADENFGIDDYVVSAESNYVAVWQLSPPADSVELRGGRSRVTSVAVNSPTEKHTLYDESTLNPVHYPVAVLSNGDIYMDKFLPNADAGWAYGMSYSNFNGSVKYEVGQMPSGSYSTQPIMSSDGKYLVFAGYDGSDGPGTGIGKNGFRRGVSTPNTVELLDLASNERRVIASSSSGIYPAAYWDASSKDPIFTYISKESDESGSFIYDILNNVTTRLEGSNVQSSLNGGAFLVADKTIDLGALGNLGGKYAQSLTSFYVDEPGAEKVRINTNGSYQQYIDVRPSNYFSTNISVTDPGKTEEKGRQLTLQTLDIKPSLAPKRLEQQSGGRCRDVTAAQCNALLGTNFTGDDARAARRRNSSSGDPAFDQCVKEQWSASQSEGACTDSPLYLYGPEGLRVRVVPGTTLYSPNVPYEQNGFNIILGKNGKFVANDQTVQSIKYDYKPAFRVEKPSRGLVVTREELPSVVRMMSEKLGLNEKETEDTIEYAVSMVEKPFVFVSFYDEITSRKILPLYFDPTPDTYRNIVFYLEGIEHDNASFDMPSFETFERKGFTAVEISFIVR